MLFDLILLVLGGFFVWLGAEGIVNGAVKLAAYFGISSMIIGLTVVAFGTSAPELVVSSMAAVKGYSEIALGNVIGSNIINIALVLGITAVITPVLVGKETLKKELPIVALITLVVVAMIYIGDSISRLDGILLLIIFSAYIGYTFLRAFKENRRSTMVDGWERPSLKTKHIVYLVGGVIGLAIGAEAMVRGAVGLAESLGISKHIIAMTIVALGTSVPELAASAVAARHGEADLCIGNIMGSNLCNMTLILGTASIIKPIEVDFNSILLELILFVFIILLLFPMMRIKWKIGRIDGAVLLLFYLLSVFVLFV